MGVLPRLENDLQNAKLQWPLLHVGRSREGEQRLPPPRQTGCAVASCTTKEFSSLKKTDAHSTVHLRCSQHHTTHMASFGSGTRSFLAAARDSISMAVELP